MSKKKYFLTEDEVRAIRDLYDGSTGRIDRIMAMVGDRYPRWYIRRIANEMGLARDKPAYWSEAEIEYLHKNYPRKGFVALQNGFKRINGGIYRSCTAIRLKAKRISINKRSDGFTMRMVEDLLGADHHKIEKWIERGWLKNGSRKGTLRTVAQGGDMHHFESKDLRDFITSHPGEVDLRRVESESFIFLVAGMM